MPKINQVMEAYTDMSFQAAKLVKDKGIHYSGENEDTFDNLKACEKNGVCGRVTGVVVRILDKIARVKNVAFKMEAKTPVEDETIVQTCIDGANYFLYIPILLAEYLSEQNNTTFEEEFAILKVTKVQKLTKILNEALLHIEDNDQRYKIEARMLELGIVKPQTNTHKMRIAS